MGVLDQKETGEDFFTCMPVPAVFVGWFFGFLAFLGA